MLQTFVCRFFLFAYLSCIAICTHAELTPSGKLNADVIPNLTGVIEVDGNLDEPQWLKAKRIDLQYITRPFENTTPPVKTEVFVFEDSDTLYVGFKAGDADISKLRAFYRDRDRVWSHDLVGIKLDTFNDNRLAYEFFANPLGIQADAIENEMTGNENDSWDGIWQSAGKILEDSYQVEIAIPLRVMNFQEGQQEKTWGAEFVRFFPRKDRLRISNIPTDRNNACTLCQLGDISGFKDAKQGRNLAIVPTLVVGEGRSRNPSDTIEWEDFDSKEIGLDFKWGVTPEVSIQATLNPDFSQVESDVAQLSINNTFALFFNEKRPFFLENADYFSSFWNLVYTRNVSAPDYGAKVTGRVDDHTFGLFVADDESTTLLVPGNLSSRIATIDEESINLALRYRYDLSDELSIGWTSTLRDSENYHNYVNGIDAKYQITPQDTFRAQLLRSETEYPVDLYQDFCDNDCAKIEDLSEAALRLKKEGEFSDTAYRLSYSHEQRNWNIRAFTQSRGADFRTDLGFGSRADHKRVILGGGYNWFSENTWWNKIRLSGDWDIAHTDAGEMIEKESEVYLSMNGRLQSYFELGYKKKEQVGLRHDGSNLSIKDNTTLFNLDSASFFFDMRPVPSLSVNMFSSYGDQIDFDNDRLGKQLRIRPRIGWDVGKHLQLNLRHTYRKLDIQGDTLFTANLTDFRATYQFDQRQFLRLILIYSNIERDPSLYRFDVTASSKSLGTQLLYSYKINPLTKFFVGYSDTAEQDDVLTSLTKSGQSIFMKFSYAWLN